MDLESWVDRDVKVRGTGIYTKDNIEAVIDVDKSTDRLLVLDINGLVGRKSMIKLTKEDQFTLKAYKSELTVMQTLV